MRKAFLIALVVFAAHGTAQITWKGLRFGMSEAEVRKTYGKELQREVTDQRETVLVDDALELLGAPLNIRARAEMSLGKGGKLEVINLITKDPFSNEKDRTSASGSSLAAIREFMTRLTDKYGQPIVEEGQCKLTAEMLMSDKPVLCNRTWKSEGQNVKMFWSIFDGRLRDFIVAYKPIGSEF